MTLTSDVATTTTIPETHTDLLSASTAILGTVGPDGRPQLSAVWFVADGDELKVSLNSTRQKTKNLRANPAVNLFILDLENPQRYLEVRGDAELAEDPDRAFAGGPVSEKYGVDVRTFDAPGATRVVVTVRPTRINAVDMSAG